MHGDCGAGEHGRPSAAGTARGLAFLHRYDRLLGLARRLAWRSRDSSADLVHDAFIQFARGCADVGAIADLDRYLAATLKNVHLAQLRRAARAKHAAGIPASLDTVADRLAGPDERARRNAIDDLDAVAQYALLRRHSLRGASMLLLRYFHAYSTAEISRLLRCPTRVVDSGIRVARHEARLYIRQPWRLVRLSRSLEARLACWPRDRHLTPEAPGDAGGQRPPATTPEAAHLAGCRTCLEAINHARGWPLLADRFPTDAPGLSTRLKATG